MDVLVTGGAGYVGSRVVERLLDTGHQVTVLDRLDYGGEALLPFLDHPRFNIDIGDIRKFSYDKVFDSVIHMAAIVGDAACDSNPDEARSTNVEGTKRILDWGQRVILFSTCSNYGVVESSSIATEDTILNPQSIYSETKIQAEDLVRSKRGSVLRFATICGVSARMRFDLMINDFADRAIHKQPIVIRGPLSWRPFIHIRDVGIAVELLLKLRHLSGVWNIVGENLQKIDVSNLITRLFPAAQIEICDGIIGGDLRSYRVSGDKALDELGFSSSRTVQQALKEVAIAVQMLPDSKRRIYRNVY